MSNKKPDIRLRLVIIKDGKVLVQYSKDMNMYFYIGGHQEFGENMLDGCIREIKEECGENYEFKFKKILYVRDYIDPKWDQSNLELFILGELNNYEGLEGKLDPQHPKDSMFTTWLDLKNLPDNLYPKQLSKKLYEDHKKDFNNVCGEYLGELS
ncbi:MAG: NUDIX domain-containing protein [Candidatus Shapirobacteria bacterium]